MLFSKCLRAKIYCNMNVQFDPQGCQTLLLKKSELFLSLGSWTNSIIHRSKVKDDRLHYRAKMFQLYTIRCFEFNKEKGKHFLFFLIRYLRIETSYRIDLNLFCRIMQPVILHYCRGKFLNGIRTNVE